MSLDLVETGGAIKFTGLSVHNPNVRWSWLDGPQEIANSAVNNIGGQVSPGGLAGNGIGPGTPDGPKVLFASVDYMALNAPRRKIRIVAASWRQWDRRLHWLLCTGSLRHRQQSANQRRCIWIRRPVGSIQVGGLGPPVISPVDLGEVSQITTITANLVVGGVATWSGDLTPLAGSPAIPATLDSNGKFSWDPTGSKRGLKGNGVLYSWSATAISPAGSTTSLALTLRLIPEPATMTHLGLAILGLLCLARRG